MHRLAATPGGWDSSAEGVVFIEQTPAPIVVLTAADTDISALSQALTGLPKDFSDLRSLNLLQLQQQLTIDTYADTVLRHAQVIILRVLGGRAYWSYGLEVVKAIAADTGAALVVMPGDDRPDLDLMGHSTVPLAVVNQLWQYFTEGGANNLRNGLLYISDRTLATHYQPPAPQPIPRIGIVATSEIEKAAFFSSESSLQSIKKTRFRQQFNEQILISQQDHYPLSRGAKVGILFYRAHYLSGNTKVIEAIAAALAQRGTAACAYLCVFSKGT